MRNSKFDILILGSGISGLASAAILSKYGKKVCIAEKNKNIGGLLSSYEINECRFDSGMHYIGAIEQGQILYRLLIFLKIYDKLSFKKLDENCFDKLNINDDLYELKSGYKNFTEYLISKFPGEKECIQNYITEIKKVNDSFKLFLNSENDAYSFLMENPFISKSAYKFLNEITKNQKLINVLSGNISLFAGNKNKTSLYLYGLISSMFIEGAYKIRGGGDSIIKALIQIIEKNGGEFLTEYEAKEFLIENNKVKSVVFSNKELIEAETIISSFHPAKTLELIDDKIIRKAYKNRINELENTISAFSVDIILKDNYLKNFNYNYYKYSSDNIWDITELDSINWPKAAMVHIPSENIDKEYIKNLSIISFMDYKYLDNIDYNSNSYQNFKIEFSNKLINFIKKDFENIELNILNKNISSPYTFKNFNYSKNGSLYGVLKDYSSPLSTFIHPRTKIENLLLTGQNIAFHGIVGTIISSILTCGEIVGLKKLIKDFKNV